MRDELLKHLAKLWPKTRKSHPLSKLLRPLFEKKGLQKLVAAQGVGMLLAAAAMIPPTHAFDYERTGELSMVDATQVEEVVTESVYKYPVLEPIGVSQQYHALHWGVDIRAAKGSGVVAIADGVVIEVTSSRYGYGEHVRVAHEGTVASLYAHLDEIYVSVGKKVKRGQVIGTVGTTGWATGPHLHFELTQGERAINPLEVI